MEQENNEELEVGIVLSSGDRLSFSAFKNDFVLPTLDSITTGNKIIPLTLEMKDKYGENVKGKKINNYIFIENIASFETDMWEITDDSSNLPKRLELTKDVEIILVNGKVLPVKIDVKLINNKNEFLYTYREDNGKGTIGLINTKFISNIISVVDVKE